MQSLFGMHRLDAGDTASLLDLIRKLQARVRAKLDVANYVLEATSILVSRRARRAKTDRLDAQGLLRVLAAYRRGEHHVCSVVRVPTPDEEEPNASIVSANILFSKGFA